MTFEVLPVQASIKKNINSLKRYLAICGKMLFYGFNILGFPDIFVIDTILE